jgi:hypothetical protein
MLFSCHVWGGELPVELIGRKARTRSGSAEYLRLCAMFAVTNISGDSPCQEAEKMERKSKGPELAAHGLFALHAGMECGSTTNGGQGCRWYVALGLVA